MSREPARPIPKGIVNARQLINDLSSDSEISISATNQFWSETELVLKPFDALISYSKENIEIQLNVTVGRIFDTSAADELNLMLPIPINISYSLEPQPLLQVSESLAVTPETKRSEIKNFITDCIMKSLMIVQTLLVTDGFVSEDKARWEKSIVPKANSLWDFSILTEQILNKNAK